jgi:hypothetical protein
MTTPHDVAIEGVKTASDAFVPAVTPKAPGAAKECRNLEDASTISGKRLPSRPA